MSTYREPLFDINPLSPSQDLSSTIAKTNELVESVNSLYAADIFEGDGICTTRTDGVVTVNVDPGPGVGIALTGEVTLNFDNVTGVSSTQNTDTLFIGRSGEIRKVNAESILPPTVLGAHTFSGLLTFSVNPSMFGFTNNIATVVAENSSAGSPKGVSIKTFVDSGLNLSPQAFIRNYTTELGSASAIFNFATTNFNSNAQNKIVVSYYTGQENSSELLTTSVASTLGWPTKWSWEYTETQAILKVATSVDSDGEHQDISALSYTYNSLNSQNSVLTVNGKISITNLQNSDQFISSPDGVSNRVVLTSTDGLINKKFTNRIITTDIEPGGLVVGDLVAIFTETANNTYYGKASAAENGNSNVIGIVETYSAGEATIALTGEFELIGAALDAGTSYILSQTNDGQYVPAGTYQTGTIKPVFVATSETTGILLTSSNSANSIGSVVLNNQTTDGEYTLDINSQNYPLRFVAGPNIQFNLTTDDEIEIRVIDAAGAQNVFTTVSLNGNPAITAASPTDTLDITSSSLILDLDTDGSSIKIEAPNLYTSVSFDNLVSSGYADFTLTPNTNSDTLSFIAGDGIVFEQNGSSVVVRASIEGGIGVDNITLGGPMRVLFSDNTSTTRTLSLYGGGDDDYFDGSACGYSVIDVALNPSKTITYSPFTQIYTYDSVQYTRHSTFPANGQYLPDELAGYMFGRVTESASDGASNPDDQLRRLSRRDVRYFLGLAIEGYIDSIDKLFNAWRIIDSGGSQVGNSVEAESKLGFINFQQGSGITLEEGTTTGGDPTIKISSTSTPQNAFSSYFVDNNEYEADTTSDSIYLESGNYVQLTGSTNNTVAFDLKIDNDYTILGKAGTTDAALEINLQNENYCLVGRAGAEIKGLGVDDFKWTFNGTDYDAPLFEMPFFGLIEVATSGSSVYLDSSTSSKIKLMGSGGISLSANGNANDGWTVTIDGNAGGGTTSSLNAIIVNKTTHAIGPSFDLLKFSNGSGIGFVSALDTDSKTVTITSNLLAINANSIMANNTAVSDAPTGLTISANSLVGRLSGKNSGNLSSLSLSDVKTGLDIRHYNRVQYTNTGGSAVQLDALGTTATSGALLKFVAGTNVSFGSSGGDSLVINAPSKLSTDSNPIVISTVPAQAAGAVTVSDGTVLKYGTATTLVTGTKYNTHLELFGVGQGSTTEYALRKEYMVEIPSGYTLQTITSDLGGFNTQKYVSNMNSKETIYGNNYYLYIKNGSLNKGAYNLDSSTMTFTTNTNVSFEGSLGKVALVNKKFSSAYTPQSGSVQNSTFVFEALNTSTNVVIKAVSAASNTAVPDANMDVHALQFRMLLNGAGTSNIVFANNSGNQQITSSGTLGFASGVAFTNAVNFTGAIVTGLNFPTHASEHQSVTNINTHAELSDTQNRLLAWQVGAVNRDKPTVRNKIAITNANGNYGFDLNAVATDSLLFGTSAASAITSSISNSTRGPMYLVLNTGEENNLATFSGPPGQIIMIKKA